MQKSDICPNRHSIMNYNRIKQERQRKNISLLQAAKATGINRNKLSDIEQGKGNPSINKVLDYITYLDLVIVLIPKEDL